MFVEGKDVDYKRDMHAKNKLAYLSYTDIETLDLIWKQFIWFVSVYSVSTIFYFFLFNK